MQFVVIAHDAIDEGTLAKRMAVRAEHLSNIEHLKETGKVICAGGILDDAGLPIGSALVLEFDSRDQLNDYLDSEPYIINHVWDDVKVENMNVVIVNDEMVRI